MNPTTPRFSLILLLGALFASSVSAATTIAHWIDFSTTPVKDVVNNYHLTRQGTSDWYLRGDNPVFTPASKTLSLEVIFQASALSSSNGAFLAGHFSPDQRSYTLAITKENFLQVVVSSDGTIAGDAHAACVTRLKIVAGIKYYVAAMIDLSSSIQAERTVTVYLKNLTTPDSPLQSQTFSNIAPANFHDSVAPFSVGSLGDGTNREYITAVFDVVRLSQGILDAGELLVAIPEPSFVSLLLGEHTL